MIVAIQTQNTKWERPIDARLPKILSDNRSTVAAQRDIVHSSRNQPQDVRAGQMSGGPKPIMSRILGQVLLRSIDGWAWLSQ